MLTLLIALPILIHLSLEFFVREKKHDTAELSIKNTAMFVYANAILAPPYLMAEINIIAYTISGLVIFSVYMASLYFNFDVKYAAVVCFFLPFALMYTLSKIGALKLHKVSEEN
ncbi:hypothetical protein [Pleionea sp. CnH1-48]|uniref:hypothetical protein n=1 Tax=Pleionea sp. CnH1-48 TaxID=2954494 RepID=UPI0020986732|nr:hypothetical protein [Pleionea sp. CnH1-48]MCO7226586.1 hypothetical protein [Pleionea sp. CnH1-48]